MESLQNKLSEEEKEALIQSIFFDKKGRSDGPAPYGLYVTLATPRPDLSQLTELMLGSLLKPQEPFMAEEWARTWGRVIVCVGPGGNFDVFLDRVAKEENKRFVPVNTTQKLSKNELTQLVDGMFEGRAGTILLNNEPTTIEAFLITYVHMIDEFIWDIYRNNLRISGKQNSVALYKEAVDFVRKYGFSVRMTSEDEILVTKVANSDAQVRLYGSQVNKDVPRVMGAVIVNKGVSQND